MRTLFCSTVLLLAAFLPAQHLVICDPVGPGFIDFAAPSPLFPGPVPPAFVYPAVPVLAPLPPGPPFGLPPGDSTVDATTGINYYTDGFLIASTPTPAYPPLAPPPPPIPIGIIGPVLAGPVTGMALDGVGGILWLTDGMLIVGTALVPGTPVIVPPFPGGPPLVGLEWDGLTGTLLGIDPFGTVFPILPGGAPAGPPIPPPVPPPGPALDVAIDKTGVPGPVGPRAIYVLYGPAVMEMTSGMMLPGSTPMALGIAFHALPANSPPVGVCPCPGMPHGFGTTGPMTAGNAAFGLTVTGLPPGQIVLHAFDFVFNPLFPGINVVGCGLGFFIGSPTLITGVSFAGPLGVATYPLPLLVPPGTGPIYHQSATLCPADPVGLVLNPMSLIAASGS